MSSIKISCQAIIDLLKSDINACSALKALLEEERDALNNRDHEALETIIGTKACHLQQLENSAKTRAEWASAHQNSQQNADQKWQHLIDQQTPEVADLWQKLKAQLQACRIENEVNGKILSRSQKTFTRILSILRGQADNTSLYNNKGGNGANLPGQPIGKA